MKDKDYFISMSHEFKSPVTNLTLFLETLYEYDKILSQDEKKDLKIGLDNYQSYLIQLCWQNKNIKRVVKLGGIGFEPMTTCL